MATFHGRPTATAPLRIGENLVLNYFGRQYTSSLANQITAFALVHQ